MQALLFLRHRIHVASGGAVAIVGPPDCVSLTEQMSETTASCNDSIITIQTGLALTGLTLTGSGERVSE
jgi:hypothetical protein